MTWSRTRVLHWGICLAVTFVVFLAVGSVVLSRQMAGLAECSPNCELGGPVIRFDRQAFVTAAGLLAVLLGLIFMPRDGGGRP